MASIVESLHKFGVPPPSGAFFVVVVALGVVVNHLVVTSGSGWGVVRGRSVGGGVGGGVLGVDVVVVVVVVGWPPCLAPYMD